MATDYRNDKYAEKIQQKLEALDIEKGLGIFADSHYEAVPDTRFLIVSYGGTGADALEAVKTNLEKYMDKEDLETKVAFLAIDTDQTSQTKKITVKEDGIETTKQVPRFGGSEFFWLKNQPGKQALMIGNEGMKQWINPRLKARVEADKKLMDGNGASGIRQLGRALLYPAEIIEGFQNQFTALVKRLTNNNGDNLKIFVLSGISGGTGSGIVVDATYLMHDFIRQMEGGIPGRTEFAGFLLLPPTGTSDQQTDKEKGNRNGIAALKEIDRFMSIAQRVERYRTNLGGRTLDIGENIFKTCYLLDGGTNNVAYSNAREKANTVVADCILDMITSLPIDNDGQTKGNTQVVDAFMSDASTFAGTMLQTTSEKLAPREANYVYCALGHGKTLIPLNLMKAYVAKRLFDHMCLTFDNCSKVTEAQVNAFLKEIKRLSVDSQLHNNLDKKLRPIFRDPDKGPYYVINLLNDAATELQREYDRLQASAFIYDKKNKLEKLNGLISHLRQMNDSTFRVYVTVMEEMKNYLNQEHGIICNSTLLERYGGSTYTFCPIDFGGTDEKAAVVKQYLDGLVNQGNVDKLVQSLLVEMDKYRREWTDLAERKQPGQKQGFDAARRIRVFWQTNIDSIVKATVEDYLLKLYSGNPKASWPKNGQPDAKTEAAMQDAAKAIVEQMWGAAGIAKPLADLRTNILTMPKFNGHNTLLIPQAAPNLRRYVQDEVANQANNTNDLVVAGSMVNDRISCYAQYTGIPAYMFGWVERAEPNYEQFLRSDNVGLHMSETRGGEQWASFPNLMVETIWPQSNPVYNNPREHGFGLLAQEAFEGAKALGLAREFAGADVQGAGNSYYYKLYSLPVQSLPDRLLLKDVDIEIEGKAAHDQAVAELEAEVEAKAEAIFKLSNNWADEEPVTRENMYSVLLGKGQAFAERDLRFTDSVMSALAENGKEPEGWTEGLATRLLRTLPNYMDEVRETVMVLNKTYEKIEKAQASKKLMREFSHYCAAGLFAFEPDDAVWSYWDEIEEEEKILVELIGIDDAQIKAKEYFLYKAFEENAEEIIRAVQPKYKRMIFKEESDKNPNNALLKEMQARSHALRDEVAALRTAKDGIASQAFAKLARQQEHSEQTIEKIRAFYKAFEKELDAARMQVLA